MLQDIYYYVYILVSEVGPDRHYTGFTKDLKARLHKHNEGGCRYTAVYHPWRLETAIAFRSKKKALAMKKYLKAGSGREFARRHF